jgi:hypothetical protein
MIWILILTLLGNGNGNPAVATVSGFKSEAACLQAAATWHKSLRSIDPGYQPYARAACVPNKKLPPINQFNNQFNNNQFNQ